MRAIPAHPSRCSHPVRNQSGRPRCRQRFRQGPCLWALRAWTHPASRSGRLLSWHPWRLHPCAARRHQPASTPCRARLPGPLPRRHPPRGRGSSGEPSSNLRAASTHCRRRACTSGMPGKEHSRTRATSICRCGFSVLGCAQRSKQQARQNKHSRTSRKRGRGFAGQEQCRPRRLACLPAAAPGCRLRRGRGAAAARGSSQNPACGSHKRGQGERREQGEQGERLVAHHTFTCIPAGWLAVAI